VNYGVQRGTILACYVVLNVALGCSERDLLKTRSINADDSVDEAAQKSTNDDAKLPQEARKELKEVARAQSKALSDAKTKVHRAFNFQQDSVYQPNEKQKLVAVDVEFSGYRTDFDLEDVEVIDGKTNENYGSDPEIRLLQSDGKLEQNESK